MSSIARPLPLVEAPGGCRCCATDSTGVVPTATPTEVTRQTFPVTGLTCGHCAGAVRAALLKVSGVTEVAVSLVPGGTSTLTVAGDRPLTEQVVATALNEAGGYRLTTS